VENGLSPKDMWKPVDMLGVCLNIRKKETYDTIRNVKKNIYK